MRKVMGHTAVLLKEVLLKFLSLIKELILLIYQAYSRINQ